MVMDEVLDRRRLRDFNFDFVRTVRISQRQSENQNFHHSIVLLSFASYLSCMAAETILSLGMPCRRWLHRIGLMTSHTVFLVDETLMVGVVGNHRIAILWRGQ